jgi:hypothetical protein
LRRPPPAPSHSLPQISFEEFTGWYQKAETKIEQQICNAFQAIDTDGDGYIDRPNIENLIRKLAGDATSGGRRRSSVARRNSAGRASFTAGSSSGGGVEMTSVAVAGKKKFTDGGEQQPGENAELSPREAFEAQKVEGQQVAFDVDEIWGQAVANAADKSRINKEEFSSWYKPKPKPEPEPEPNREAARRELVVRRCLLCASANGMRAESSANGHVAVRCCAPP